MSCVYLSQVYYGHRITSRRVPACSSARLTDRSIAMRESVVASFSRLCGLLDLVRLSQDILLFVLVTLSHAALRT